MEIKNLIREAIYKHLNTQRSLNEDSRNVDAILDKINSDGVEALSYDERIYLKQYNNKNINPDLEEWLFSDNDETFDLDGNKLLFDEFGVDEDIFYNYNKLKRVISKHLNKLPYTNSADWGGGYVWNIKSDNKFTGTFLYLGDDELLVINRTLYGDEYIDNTIRVITNAKELYKFLLALKTSATNAGAENLNENTEEYPKWKRKNVTLRGVKELGKMNEVYGSFGKGLYTVPLSNKAMAKQYGDVYFVVNAVPKTPKIVDSLNNAELLRQRLINNFCQKHNKNYDMRFFEANTTMEDEMLNLGYDGLIIKGREMVNYTPKDIKYFKTEHELQRYYETLL